MLGPWIVPDRGLRAIAPSRIAGALALTVALGAGLAATAQSGGEPPTAEPGVFDTIRSWATRQLGDWTGEAGGGAGREVAAVLLETGAGVSWAALRDAGLWGGAGLLTGLLLTAATAWWMRARAVLGCLWALFTLPCAVLGAAYCGLSLGAAGALTTAVDEGLLLERLAVTSALATYATPGEGLASGAVPLSRQLAETGSDAGALLRQGSSGLAQLAESQGRLTRALLSPQLLSAVVEAIGVESAPAPGVLLALAAGPGAIERLPEGEGARARALLERTAPLRRQASLAVEAAAWGNALGGGLLAALPLLVALPLGLLVRLLGRKTGATPGVGSTATP